MKKKKSALNRARSALKKAEGAHAVSTIKRKLLSKKEKKK